MFCNLGCSGLFATHLHEIFGLPLQLRNTPAFLQMQGMVDVHNIWQPNWRITQGRCDDSRAIDAAVTYGLPPAVVQRARELCTIMDARHGPECRETLEMEAEALQPPAMAPLATPDGVAQCSIERAPLTSTHTLMDVVVLLETTVAGYRESKQGANQFVDSQQAGRPKAVVLSANQIPPPAVAAVDTVCVYVLKTFQGSYYVGETSNLLQRLEQHQQCRERAPARCVYIMLYPAMGLAGRSDARSIESLVITAMFSKGFPMLSTADAATRNA